MIVAIDINIAIAFYQPLYPIDTPPPPPPPVPRVTEPVCSSLT